MHLQLHIHDLLAEGERAHVFAPGDGTRAYKLYTRLVKFPDPRIARRAFESEIAAYGIATRDPALRPFVPRYFGPVQVSEVLDTAGNTVTSRYWPELCFCIERLESDPEECKYYGLADSEVWDFLGPLDQRFENAGIDLGDASVLYWRTRHPRIIDLRMNEAASAS